MFLAAQTFQFPIHLLPLFLLIFTGSTLQQDPPSPPSACGIGSSLQIDPTRPNNVIVAGINPSPGGNRYVMVQMDQLVRNICSQAVPSEWTKPFPSRFIITRCDECTRCPQELSSIHRALVQIASQSRPSLSSLLVILAKELDRLRPGPRQIDNSLVKFVYSTDDDPGLLTLCDSESADGESLKNFSKTSVLFVSISFIILIVISLAWLVFYYVQRFRYAHAKDRLQRRLFNAAKKALARIPTRPVKAGDKELCSDCPVCIDPYKPGDICRQLPCRHIFHKSCVDPWLLEHRTCPMCKSDILKAFGYHVSGRRRAQFSANVEEDGPTGEHDMHREGDRMSLESTGSESANPFHDVVTEVHDPFGFSPSPQLVQMVHNANNDFQIIPLAIQTPNPHCEIIQAPIERHHSIAVDPSDEMPNAGGPCSVAEAQNSEIEQKTTKENANGENRPQSQSTSLRLFRAVTGRRRHVNANLVQISRSRSFSQSQITPIKMENVGDGNAGTTKAIIYSVNNGDGFKEATMANSTPKQTKSQTESRAVTAPEGFRRKVGSSPQAKHGKLDGGNGGGNGQRATTSTETRVDMEMMTNATL